MLAEWRDASQDGKFVRYQSTGAATPAGGTWPRGRAGSHERCASPRHPSADPNRRAGWEILHTAFGDGLRTLRQDGS